MPTYAYACDSCGLAKDEWLKVSEALSVLACPSCGKASYRKQLTAPAFQLKGSGWYVTDFRNKDTANKPNTAAKSDNSSDTQSAATSDTKAAPAKTESAGSDTASSTSASAPAPASAPATTSAKPT